MIHLGDSVEVMAGMEAESVDAIVTDPPYGLEFMGKEWDRLRMVGTFRTADRARVAKGDGFGRYAPGIKRTGYSDDPRPMQAWHEAWAREAFRVAKPGAHLLAFGGTRTYHRLASAIEDAGWEIRDCLVWAYASGFPKSLDVSKAIDKANGRRFEDRFALGRHIRERREAAGLSREEVSRAVGSIKKAVHYESQRTDEARVPTPEDWAVLEPLLGLSDAWLPLVERVAAEREVVGTKQAGMGSGETFGMLQAEGSNGEADHNILVTAPATPDAEKWDGWGTALKPAWEPIVMARKPLRGTVAANVLRYSTGALNIAATRISGAPRTTHADGNHQGTHPAPMDWGEATGHATEGAAGRWPANLILTDPILNGHSRFFLIPKSSRSDREPRTRDEALRLHRESGACDKLPAWRSPDLSPTDPTDSTSPARAISARPSMDARHSDMSSPGNRSTDQSPAVISSTTSTATSRTTRSRTSSSSIPSPTSASTPAVSSELGNGGSPATSADDSSLWGTPTGTYPERDGPSMAGAGPATSRGSYRTGGCADCGKPLPRVSSHPTVKPLDLMRHLVRLVTPPGGVVLDPFLGSGTTAIAAEMEGFTWIGIEKEPEYVAIAEARLNGTQRGMAL